MNEQRVQAYIALISQLLNCADGQEPAVLQAHQELLDPGLLQVMAAVADQMRQQGNETTAQWLQNLAGQLAEAMGLSKTSGQAAQESRQFFLEVLQCIEQHQGAAEPVYQFLASHQTRLNADLLDVLPATATTLFANAPKENHGYIAAVFVDFGNLLAQFPLGQRAINLELAIAAYEQSLQVMTREAMPVEWATSMMNLANAYADRIRGDRAENIEAAIAAYEQSLQVMTREAMPVEWATSMMNLATAYADRIRGDRAQNIEAAIAAYEQSLQMMTRDAMPVDWATSMNNLATAYKNRIRGDRAQNIEAAIDAYQQSLQVRTRDAMPVDWATSMMNLANAYSDRIRGDRAENIEAAIDAYQQSLQVRTREAMPVDWATSMMNLANAYSDRIRGDRAENIEAAIDAYQQSLQVMTREAMPVEWAQLMGNLANAYSDRIRGDRAENIEAAIDAYQQSLQVMTRDAMPVDWATSMNNLATAYKNRIRGDRAQNIEAAINAYQQSLQMMTRDAMPVNWAQSMNNLANAYYSRIRGDRAKNIEAAIAAYQQSLQVRTRAAMPVDWAQSMMNLATAYADRIRGDRAQNIEAAIAAYQQSLQVRTREAMPVDWAQSMMNLATAYADRIRGDRAQNIEAAIDTYQQSLQVRTREAMPVDWAKSMMNLANAYQSRIRGDRAQNIEAAIDTYQQSLQVMTREAMPVDWAKSMMNLANAYQSRIRGDRAQNIEAAIAAYQQSLKVFKPELLPNDCRRTARLLANLYADNHRWAEAVVSYATALTAAEILYQASLFRSSQEAELSETNDLFRCAAYAQAQVGNLPKAIETAEVGRARGLSETLERDRADLKDLETTAPDLYQQYQQAAKNLRQLEVEERSMGSTTTDPRPSLSQAELRQRAVTIRQELTDAIAAIRKHPGYETFLAQPSFIDIAATVQPGQPLVYLIPTPNSGLALILHRSQSEGDAPEPVEITPVWLNALTDASLRELLIGSSEEAGGWFGAYSNQSSDPDAWFQAIDQTTHQLWPLVMEPVVTQLKALNVAQAVLIPTSFLSFLPLHAAWTEDAATPTGRRYALDAITFTYAPNARSLQAARAVGQATAATSLLAINEPRPTTANPLPSSEREVEVAVDSFNGSHDVLKHEKATRDTVLAALPHHNVLHFSCHGYANFASPLDSGLLMASDEVLSLRDFFNTDLKGVRLAILSACETGLPGLDLPDEVVSLPTGLLQAGVAGIAASLWSVSDLSTMMLLTRFYDYWQNDKLSPPQALRSAQQWVRDTSNKEKVAYFKGFISELAVSRMSHAAASTLYQSLAFADADANDVAHPFYWAAFTYVGV